MKNCRTPYAVCFVCIEGLKCLCVLYVAGSRGKCIRTEESWFTPEQFVMEEPTITDGHWKKNILCHGKTLNFLLKVSNWIEHRMIQKRKNTIIFLCICYLFLSFLERDPAHPFSSVRMCAMQ